MRAALLKCGLPPALAGDRQQGPWLASRAPVLAPYVDNVNMIALGPASGDKLFTAVLEELRRRRLVLRDLMYGEPVIEFLGMVLDRPRRLLRHSDKRLWRPWAAIGFVLDTGFASGEVMRVINGHLCHFFGLRVPALSVLQSTFAFARNALGQRLRAPQEMWNELWTCRALLPLIEVDLVGDFACVT